MGLVTQVFSEDKLQGLRGQAAVAHCRYSTTGAVHWANAQPVVQHGSARTVALGHNGNLVNTTELRAELDELGVKLRTTSDTEVIAAFLANDHRPLEEAVAATMARLEGAYTIVLLEGKLVGFRDPGESAHSLSATWAATRCSRRRPARSTCSEPTSYARSHRASSSSGTRTVCAASRRCRRVTAAHSASSSSSTSRGRTRSSVGSSCTARACAWASGSRRRRPSKPTWSSRSRTRERRPRSASHARAGSRSTRG